MSSRQRGSTDNTLRVWDLNRRKCLRTLGGHTHGVLSVSITPDGKRAVSGSGDKTLRLWDLETGELLAIFQAGAQVASIAEVRASGNLLIGLSNGESVIVTAHNFPTVPPVVTPVRVWLCGELRSGLFGMKRNKGRWDDGVKATCPWCGSALPGGRRNT